MMGLELNKEERRKRRRRRKGHRRPINVLASVLTTCGLYCGMASIFAAISGNSEKAALYILAAIVFDSLDGTVAKLTHSVSDFGKQLDSLCDLVSFGAAPAVLIYTAYWSADPAEAYSRLGVLFAGIYVICGALRLARFTLYHSEKRDYFVGLPIPAAGGTIAALVLFAGHIGMDLGFWLVGPFTLALAVLMVSTIAYPKEQVKAFVLTPRRGFRFLLLCGVLIALFGAASHQSPKTMLFPIACGYVLYGVIDEVYCRLRKGKRGSFFMDAPASALRPASESREEPPAP